MLPVELEPLENAEQLFEWLGQSFDPAVLSVYRVHILKRFGQRVARSSELDRGNLGSTCWREYGEILREVYESYATGTAHGGPLGRLSEPPLITLRRPQRRTVP